MSGKDRAVKTSFFPNRITFCRAVLFALLVASSSAQAEDKFDVRGGHFNRDEINKDFFSHPENAPPSTPDAAPAPSRDSWEVDGSSFSKSSATPPTSSKEQLNQAVQDAQKNAADPTAPFSRDGTTDEVPADLTRAAQAIEQLKAMIKTPGASAPGTGGNIPSVIDQARGGSGTVTPPSPSTTYPAPVTPLPPSALSPEPKTNEPPTLSVIISAYPEQHLVETVRKIADLKQRGAVKIGSISILGLDDVYNTAAQTEAETIYPPVSEDEQKKMAELQKKVESGKYDDSEEFKDMAPPLPPKPGQLKILEDVKLMPSGVLPLEPLFKKYQATSSPIWIVKASGSDHVFEGSYNPTSFFDANGRFIAADRNNPREENHVVIHQSQSGPKFQRSQTSSDPRFAFSALTFRFIDKPGKANASIKPTPPHEGGKFNLPFLPNCERPASRKTTVAQQMMNGGFDIVFYSTHDQGQVNASQKWEGKSVGYNSGKAVEYKDPDGRWQMLALTAHIRCLPTRFHFFEENSQRYLEYREGESAWVK